MSDGEGLTSRERIARDLGELGLWAAWCELAERRRMTGEEMLGSGMRAREGRAKFRRTLAASGWTKRALDHLFRLDAATGEDVARAAELVRLVGLGGLEGSTSLDVVTGSRVPAAVAARHRIIVTLRARMTERAVCRLLGCERSLVQRARRAA